MKVKAPAHGCGNPVPEERDGRRGTKTTKMVPKVGQCRRQQTKNSRQAWTKLNPDPAVWVWTGENYSRETGGWESLTCRGDFKCCMKRYAMHPSSLSDRRRRRRARFVLGATSYTARAVLCPARRGGSTEMRWDGAVRDAMTSAAAVSHGGGRPNQCKYILMTVATWPDARARPAGGER